MKKKIQYLILLFIIMISVVFNGCSTKTIKSLWEGFLVKNSFVYPEPQNMTEYRRSFTHSGKEYIYTSFDEAAIKSSTIVRANLIETDDKYNGYCIYTFDVQESLKNPFNDNTIYLYEPKLSNNEYMYSKENDYILVLSRINDVYYENYIFQNFNSVLIEIDDRNKINYAMSSKGKEDIKKNLKIKTYEELLSYINKIHEENILIKEGIYAYNGRMILSDKVEDIVAESDYIGVIKIGDIIYENDLFIESNCQVVKKLKGDLGSKITLSIPKNIHMNLEELYLVCMFKDGNYRISSRNSVIAKNNKDLYEEYIQVIKDFNKEEVEETPTPIVKLIPKPKKEQILNALYKPWIEINKDVVGWYRIDGTVIDYPVLQGKDNIHYLDYDIYGNKSVYGSITLDFRCDNKNIARNTMVYGHNMKDKSMFYELTKYKNSDFFKTHKIIEFNTLYEEMEWEVFSVFVVDSGYNNVINYPMVDDVEFQEFLDDVTSRSMYNIGIIPNLNDKILTMVTCSYEFDGARTIVCARLVLDS